MQEFDTRLGNSLVFHYNIDANGNRTTVKIDETKQISPLQYMIQLSQNPDNSRMFKVVDKNGNELHRVENMDDINAESYYLNAENGLLYFDSSRGAENVVISYNGQGYELIGASRVYDETDCIGSTIKQTLQDIINKGREYIKAIELLGGAIPVITRLENDIADGMELYANLENDIEIAVPLQASLHKDIQDANTFRIQFNKDVAEGKELYPKLHSDIAECKIVNNNLDMSLNNAKENINLIRSSGNPHFEILSSDWISNTDTSSTLGYMKDITHNLETQNIIINAFDITTGMEIFPNVKRIDNNTLRFFNDNNIDGVKVILSARYYDGGSDIGDEVKSARKTFQTIGKRFDNIDSQLADIAQQKIDKSEFAVNVKDFGAKGDGTTDDWQALTNAIEFAKNTKKRIKLNGKHYVTKSIDFTGIDIIIGNGCYDSILYDKRMYNGEIIGHKWFSDNRPPYKIFVDGLSGDLICSDVANPIVVCTSEGFKTDGIGIYGWYGNPVQIGFADYKSEPTEYSGTIKAFNNTKIKYCGSHGMHLKRGIEYFNPIGLECRDNGGHGLFVERKLAINPCEYSNFVNCRFDNNYLDGIYLKGFKKNIKLDTCQFSRQGQYHLGSQEGKNREYPVDFKDVKTGVRYETYGGIPGSGIVFVNCYGEDCNSMAYGIGTYESGVINNIKFENIVQIPIQYTEEQKAWKKAVAMFSGNWIQSVEFSNNFGGTGVIGVYNVDATFFGGLTLKGNLTSTYNVKDTVLNKNISLKQSNSNNSTQWVDTFDASVYFNGTGNLKGIYPVVLMLSSNWQANNAMQQGNYMLVVTKGHNGKYKINTLAFTSVSGFPNPPTIDDTTGIITINISAYYAYTITRLDMNNIISLA